MTAHRAVARATFQSAKVQASRMGSVSFGARSNISIASSEPSFLRIACSSEGRDVGRAELWRPTSINPFKDYVTESDTTNFMVTWPLSDESSGLTKCMLDRLSSIRQSTTIQVTPPFHVLDGSGDKLASICIVPPVGAKSAALELLDDWLPKGTWIERHSALNALNQ